MVLVVDIKSEGVNVFGRQSYFELLDSGMLELSVSLG